MSTFSEFWNAFSRFGLEAFGRYYSVYRAQVAPVNQQEVGLGRVSGNIDPMNQGRIRVIVPGLGMTQVLPEPAYPVTPFGSQGAAAFFPPDPGDTVMVVFENGNPRLPLWIGSWWMNPRTGLNPSPSATDLPQDFRKGSQPPTVRGIETKSGHKILFDDTPGQSKVTIQTGNKQNQIVMDDTKNSITIAQAAGSGPLIEIDPSGMIRLYASDADESFVLGTSFLAPGTGGYFTHIHPVDTPSGETEPPISPGFFTSSTIFGE